MIDDEIYQSINKLIVEFGMDGLLKYNRHLSKWIRNEKS